MLDTPKKICIERARNERPPEWLEYIENRFRDYTV